jgi:hypothetical protein
METYSEWEINEKELIMIGNTRVYLYTKKHVLRLQLAQHTNTNQTQDPRFLGLWHF